MRHRRRCRFTAVVVVAVLSRAVVVVATADPRVNRPRPDDRHRKDCRSPRLHAEPGIPRKPTALLDDGWLPPLRRGKASNAPGLLHTIRGEQDVLV
eukprot:7786161-Alexandrium_andersonii.AAC.1